MRVSHSAVALVNGSLQLFGGLPIALRRRTQLLQRNQSPPLFVPEHEANASETLEECHAPDVPKLPVIVQNLGQTVEWYPAREMMHVVHPDVGREPADN